MTKLSPTQSEILAAAAASDDATTIALDDAKSAVAGLIKRGLLTSIPRPDGPSRLMITAAGKAFVAAAQAADAEPAAARVDQPARPPARRPATIIAISRLAEREPCVVVGPSPSAKDGDTAAPVATVALSDPPKGKIGALVCLLRQESGTTIEAMMSATGWQAHSVRGALSGAIKKGLGLEVISQKTDVGRVYRIASGEAA